MHMHEQWWLHCTSQVGVVDTFEWACVLGGCHIQNDWASRATNLCQILCKAWTFLRGNYSDDSEGCGYGQLVIGSSITTHPLMHHFSCRVFWRNILSPRWLSSPYRPDLVRCNFWLCPKLKSPLKGKSINEIQENMTGSWLWLGKLCEVPRYPLWRGMRHYCPMYNVSCILYFLQ